MGNKWFRENHILLSFHSGCRRVIFDALGIIEMKKSGLFIFAWYISGFSLAYSIGILRKAANFHSFLVFLLSIILIILLTLSGLGRGHLKKRFHQKESKNEK